MTLKCDRWPCPSCPYRRDAPPGVWHADEYEKLRGYDNNEAFGVFLCHQTHATGVETVCRGWLTVAAESVAARLAVMRCDVTDEQRYAPVDVDLYATGSEAADAGLAGVPKPGTQAQRMIARLAAKGIGEQLDEGDDTT